MIDLMSIARTEADGGDLFGTLQGLFQPTDVRPEGYPDAVVWRYASTNDVIQITKAVTVAVLVFLPVMFLWSRAEFLPRSFLVINWFVLIALLGGPPIRVSPVQPSRVCLP